MKFLRAPRRDSIRFAACALLILAFAGTADAAITVNPSNATLGQTVTVTADVQTGDGSYAPAFYVDWLGGGCPASVRDARSAAIGNTTRGLGLAREPGNFYSDTGTEPVTARVTLEQPSQHVCFYGGDGAPAGDTTIGAQVVIPPLDQGKAPQGLWSLATSLVRLGKRAVSCPLCFAIGIEFKQRRVLADPRPVLTCKRKRFYLKPSGITLGTDGSISYNGSLNPDNSNDYDAPVPLKYHGHATLRFHSSAPFVGRAPLVSPIDSLTGASSGFGARSFKLGEWGLPNSRVVAHFSAPGFHPFPGVPGCGSKLTAVFVPGMPSPAMLGQGTARTGQTGGVNEEAGKPLA